MNDKINKILSRVNKHYRIESVASVKKEELIDFFKTAYSDQFNAADYRDDGNIIKRWEWANLRNPNLSSGSQLPAWVCKEDNSDRIVGHFGIIPIILKLGRDCYPAAWGRDLIVLPKFRKLGIGPFLIDNVLKDIKDKVDLFLIAGLNDYIYSIYKKLDFIDLGYVPLYIRFNRFDSILQNKIHNKIVAGILGICGITLLKTLYLASYISQRKYTNYDEIIIRQITNFDTTFDYLWEKASVYFPVIVKRDSVSLNWRFIQQPYWQYKIYKAESRKDNETKGYIVLREGKSHGLNVGIISDLFAQSDDVNTVASLINFAIKYFEKKDNIDLIRCNILHKKFAHVLKKFCFIGIRSSSRFMLTNIRSGMDQRFIINRDNWFINYADSDLDLSC